MLLKKPTCRLEREPDTEINFFFPIKLQAHSFSKFIENNIFLNIFKSTDDENSKKKEKQYKFSYPNFIRSPKIRIDIKKLKNI